MNSFGTQVTSLIFRLTAGLTAFGACLAVSAADVLPLSDQGNEGGWQVQHDLSDEFEGPLLDRAKWIVQGENGYYYQWRGRAPSQFAAHNVRVEDGKLKLRTQWEPDFEFSTEKNVGNAYGVHEGKPMPVTTGAIIGKHRFMHGYVEVKSRAADAAITSSFWSLGYRSEIDFYEQMGRPKGGKHIRDNYYMFSIYDWRPPVVRPNKVWTHAHELPFRVADDFHVYGCEWGEDYLRFYVDGELVRETTRAEVGERWTLTNPIELWFDSEIFSWLGMPHQAELPADYQVEYVRVWQKPNANHLNRALFGFEGPLHVAKFKQPLGAAGEQARERRYQQDWFIDKRATPYLSIVDDTYARGRKSLRFDSGEHPPVGSVTAISPVGTVALTAGPKVLSFDVMLAPGSRIEQLQIKLMHPHVTLPPIKLGDVASGEWVSISRPFVQPTDSAGHGQLQLSVLAQEGDDAPSRLHVDNISIVSVAAVP